MNSRFFLRSLLSVFVLWFALSPTLSYASEYEPVFDNVYGVMTTDEIGTFDLKDSELMSGYLQTSVSARFRIGGSGYSPKTLINYVDYIPPFSYEEERTPSNGDYNFYTASKDKYQYYVTLSSKNDLSIFDKDKVYDINLGGLFFAYHQQYLDLGGTTRFVADVFDPKKITGITLTMFDKSDGSGSFTEANITDSLTINGDTFGINLNDFEMPIDCKRIRIWFTFDVDALSFDESQVDYFNKWLTVGKLDARFIDSTLTVTEVDQTAGLLSGIVSWLQSIRDGIVNVGDGVTNVKNAVTNGLNSVVTGVSNVKNAVTNGLTNVVNSIIELPSKIWNVFETGIKSLFVPSEADISTMHEKWQNLMRDRFGAIYQSGDIVHSFSQTMSVNSAMVADTGGIITMPAVTANLAGTNFTFGGYEVDLVPDGFQWLVTSLKMLINIVCTILFINALKGKIEVLLR